MKIKNFKAPKVGLRDSDGASFEAPDDDDEDEKEPPTADEVEELVQKHIEPDLWGEGKHRMSQFRGQLVVSTSADVHRKVAVFLNTLRSAR